VYSSSGKAFAPGAGRYHVRNQASVVMDSDAVLNLEAAACREGQGDERL
jgi:hypothetical protein